MNEEDEVPAQLQKLQAAMPATSDVFTATELKQAISLLAQMCHPELSKRISAEQICKTTWLQNAAARPLPQCSAARLEKWLY